MNPVAGKNISELLRELIHELRVKDVEFAKKCDIKKATLSNYVNGKSQPDWQTLQNIVLAYCVNPQWILTGDGEMFQGITPEEPSNEAQPQPATAGDQTPIEREMETFERLMLKYGASKEEIRQGLMARMGVPTKPEKSSHYDSLRQVSGSTLYPGVHESDSDPGKGI